MTYPDDDGLVRVLERFAIAPDALLGHGGEAWVYALDDARVLRILHAGGQADDVQRRQCLVDELALAEPAFALPEVLSVGDVNGRIFAIERRLRGRSVMDELRSCEDEARPGVIESYLGAAAVLGDLYLEPRDWFGDLAVEDCITTSTWREYLKQRAAVNLARSIRELWSIDPVALGDSLPEPDSGAFVHLDAFAGNMLTDGSQITAVLDIGPTSVIGDRRLDPVAAVVYLTSPEITPVATPADLDVAMSWLRSAGLQEWLEPAQRWLAAFWSFAVDDPRLLAWCRSVLLPAP